MPGSARPAISTRCPHTSRKASPRCDERLAVQVLPGHRNHHLWDNNGTWFIHYTLHLADYSKRRVRQSLETKSLPEARRRRDRMLERAWKVEGRTCKVGRGA